jgi:hypothetical protein
MNSYPAVRARGRTDRAPNALLRIDSDGATGIPVDRADRAYQETFRPLALSANGEQHLTLKPCTRHIGPIETVRRLMGKAARDLAGPAADAFFLVPLDGVLDHELSLTA